MTPQTSERLEALRGRVREGMARYQIPGVALGVLCDGEHICITEGVTNHQHPLEVTRQTLFQVGSTTKTVTGTVIMRLVQDGLLELEAPVRAYLPTLKLADEDTATRVTVRQLLNHTGGWVGDLFGRQDGEGDDALARYVERVATMPQITPLGTVWHYNNAAFGVAGRVVEAITKERFEDVVKTLVLGPLGMRDSHFFCEEVMTKRFVVGHHLDDTGQVRISQPWSLGRACAPIGLLVSSVTDQLKYAHFHMHGNPKVLDDELRLEMQRPTVPGQLGDLFGLTWWINDATGERIVSHGGATNGQMSAFWFVPARGFACTILTNADKGNFLNNELSAWMRENFLGLSVPQTKTLALSNTELEAYTGRYVGQAFGTVIELGVQDGVLMRKIIPGDVSSVTTTPSPPLPPAACQMLEGEVLQVAEGEAKGAKQEFLRDTKGRIAWLRSGGRLYAKQL